MTARLIALVPNPAWAGRQPSQLTQSDCHDRSHFVTIECQCGTPMHLHESRIAGLQHAEIGVRCRGCGEPSRFPPGSLHDAFAELRKQGWIQ